MSEEQALVIPEERETPPATALIQVIERAAINPDVDIDKMERLLQMQERIFEREAQIKFNQAMADVRSEIQPVVRDAQNTQTNSMYSRLETISKVVDPIIANHGITLSYDTDDCPIQDHYRLKCKISHIGGHSEWRHADLPIDITGMKGTPNKTRMHAFGSTMSYGRRYLKLLIFDIAMKGEDDDGQGAGGVKKVTEDQIANLEALMTEVGADRGRFLKWAKAGKLADIQASFYPVAIKMLEAKRK